MRQLIAVFVFLTLVAAFAAYVSWWVAVLAFVPAWLLFARWADRAL